MSHVVILIGSDISSILIKHIDVSKNIDIEYLMNTDK